VMGVAGSGKSTLAAAIARQRAAALIEGDDHHLPESVDKMRRGVPLDDEDRAPWLAHLAQLLAAEPGDAVLACSALKRRYRERLRAGVPALQIVFIDIDLPTALARVAARQGHLFPPQLLASQFDALESPRGEDGVLCMPAHANLSSQVDEALRWLAAIPSLTTHP
jgi:gluconokinase